jgi:Na+/melibiose symporter-like transporter
MTAPEAVKDKEFWHILAMVTLSISYGFFTKVAFKSYGSTNINDDIYLTRVALYGFITAATSRFIWPFLQGIIGFKKVYAAILCMQLLVAFSMPFIAHNANLYAVWICISWCCEGG